MATVNFMDVRLPDRFWDKCMPEPNSGCWLWIAPLSRGGYGQFSIERSKQRVRSHRFAYEVLVGPIDRQLESDHLCRVRCCVNPAHIEPVTKLVNIRRGDGGKHWSAKTHCPKGHPYDEKNTLINLNVRGTSRRNCRKCGNEKNKKPEVLERVRGYKRAYKKKMRDARRAAKSTEKIGG